MTSIAKLKDRARKHEQKEDWKAAIEAYQRVLEAEEGQDEVELELGLYNRVGDLYLRIGQTDQAVSYYERAADKYAESGFYNNAIALCNKALRHRPNRPETYLKLSRLCIEQGFIPDARRWMLDYAERQVRAGNVEEALTELQDFAGTTDDPDVRELLARHLAHQNRPDEAVDQLRRAHATFVTQRNEEAARRVAGRAHELDPSVDLDAEAQTEEVTDFASGVVDRGGATPGDADASGLAGLETHRHEPDGGDAEEGGLQGLESTGQAGDAVPDQPLDLGGLETFAVAEPEEDEEAPEPLPLLEEDEEEDEAGEPLPLLDQDGGADEEDEEDFEDEEELEAAEDFEEEEEEEEEDFEEEEAPVRAAAKPPPGRVPDLGLDRSPGADDPTDVAKKYGIEPMDLDAVELSFGPSDMTGDPADAYDGVDVNAVLDRARELVARALTSEALKELRILSGSDASPELFRQALSVANEIARHDANDIGALQARVEFAAAAEDRELLIGAYLDLADALARMGSETKARAMYERVLDLEPDNEAAQEALGVATDEAEAAVDLDAILREMEPEKKTRKKKAKKPEPSDPAFAAMLSQLKSRAADPGEGEDAGDHYDLGLAFKEMGLIDEAIAEFQTALTAGEERLKVYEELGQCFVMKRQFNVAVKIFKRALQMPHEAETDLLGVYYLLGQCHEELGQRDEAREAYEKVLSIDASFADVPARVARL